MVSMAFKSVGSSSVLSCRKTVALNAKLMTGGFCERYGKSLPPVVWFSVSATNDARFDSAVGCARTTATATTPGTQKRHSSGIGLTQGSGATYFAVGIAVDVAVGVGVLMGTVEVDVLQLLQAATNIALSTVMKSKRRLGGS